MKPQNSPLQMIGDAILFNTLSNAFVFYVTTCQRYCKRRANQDDCQKIVNSDEGLDLLSEWFGLDYDTEYIKNTFNYFLRKSLTK